MSACLADVVFSDPQGPSHDPWGNCLGQLDHTAEADITRWRLASLQRRTPVSRSGSRPFLSLRIHSEFLGQGTSLSCPPSTWIKAPSDRWTQNFRPILDLRGLQIPVQASELPSWTCIYLKVLPFHMLTTIGVISIIWPGDWFTSIDLENVSVHVAIASSALLLPVCLSGPPLSF